jgi:endonuclease III
MESEDLKAKISSLQKQLSDKHEDLKKEHDMNDLHQETITLLVDYKLVMQLRDEETREFLKALLEAFSTHQDDFHLELADRIQDYLKHIEWIPEME